MPIADGAQDNQASLNPTSGRARPSYTIIIAVTSALIVTAALLTGYMALRRRHTQRILAAQQSQTAPNKPVMPAQVQVYENEALIKGSQAIIGGTVHNISHETLSDLSVEIELRRRKDGRTEMRQLRVEPREIAPDEQGQYSLAVQSRDYINARLISLKSGANAAEVGFKTAQGAKRPPERTPQPTKTIIVKRPPPKNNGEEFLNSPDNPAKIP